MIRLWFMLKGSGAPISTAEIVAMALRKTLTREIATAIVFAHKAGLSEVDFADIEAHGLAGGRPNEVVGALSRLRHLGEAKGFIDLAAVDLSGVSPIELVEAFETAREAYPDLTFDELILRSVRKEPVIEQIECGEFVPLARQEGWVVRLTVGPFTTEELHRRLREDAIPKDARVRPGAGGEWRSAGEVLRELDAAAG